MSDGIPGLKDLEAYSSQRTIDRQVKEITRKKHKSNNLLNVVIPKNGRNIENLREVTQVSKKHRRMQFRGVF